MVLYRQSSPILEPFTTQTDTQAFGGYAEGWVNIVVNTQTPIPAMLGYALLTIQGRDGQSTYDIGYGAALSVPFDANEIRISGVNTPNVTYYICSEKLDLKPTVISTTGKIQVEYSPPSGDYGDVVDNELVPATPVAWFTTYGNGAISLNPGDQIRVTGYLAFNTTGTPGGIIYQLNDGSPTETNCLYTGFAVGPTEVGQNYSLPFDTGWITSGAAHSAVDLYLANPGYSSGTYNAWTSVYVVRAPAT